MYAILGEPTDLQDPFKALAGMREAASTRKGNFSFVWTFPEAEGADDLLEHLRCKAARADGAGTSKTFAVIEDFENEYRYCINVGDGKDLSSGRLSKTLESFHAGTLKPDELRSLDREAAKGGGAASAAAEGKGKKPGPRSTETTTTAGAPSVVVDFEPGAVTELVAADVVSAVHTRDKDVILHIFADVDAAWERQRYELTKLAEWAELERPDLAVAVMDGLRNERPPDLPEVGFIPVTIMFPAAGGAKEKEEEEEKDNDDDEPPPLIFDAKDGFTADRLKEWLKVTSEEQQERKKQRDGGGDSTTTPPPPLNLEGKRKKNTQTERTKNSKNGEL